MKWLDPYSDARSGFAPFIKTVGSMVMGRRTYDQAVKQGYASFGDMPTYVVTHRPIKSRSTSVIPFKGDLRLLVEQIRERHPRNIWLMGGGIVTKAFFDEDLVDIWSIAFVPTLLGAGLPMFPAGKFSERRLKLVRTRKYPSGVMELRYERRPTRKRIRAAR